MRTFDRVLLIAATSLGLLVSSSIASAQETVICGWDFSQYAGSGVLTTDGSTLADTLSANYSDFDPTRGAGAESAAFGTMYIDGSNGSTESTFNFTPLAPTSGSLASNINGPQNGVPSEPFSDVPFDSFTTLQSEGQAFTNLLSMVANDEVDAVFQADKSGTAEAGGGSYTLVFAGQTLEGTSMVDVEFSAGSSESYSLVDTVMLTETDQEFSIPLGSTGADSVFVRLAFTPDNETDLPLIDNLMITATVPEPGAGLSLAAAMGTLATLRRARRRA